MKPTSLTKITLLLATALLAPPVHADNPAQSGGPRVALYSGLVMLTETTKLLTPANNCCARPGATQWNLAATAEMGKEYGPLQIVAKQGQRCDSSAKTFEVSALLGEGKVTYTGMLIRKSGGNALSGILSAKSGEERGKEIMIAIDSLTVPSPSRCR